MRSEINQNDSLQIHEDVLKGIIAHARQESPVEACGYLAGTEGVVTSFVSLQNIEQSTQHYSFDPAEQFGAVREIRKSGLKPMAVYHSHPCSPARPSQEDIRLAYDPDLSYVIVSLQAEVPSVKSFRIQKGSVIEEGFIIVQGGNNGN